MITAAAAVMVAVFGAFAISGDRVLEMFGLAMASAVLLDALVVRMLLLPAVLQLLGRTTWALPRWLDRRLPELAIEAEPGPALAAVARAGVRGRLMTDQRTLDRLIAHLRGQVAELRRLGRRKGPHRTTSPSAARLILRLQDRLSYVVRDLLNVQRTSPT